MTNLESPANRQRTVPLQISRHLEEATIRVLPLSSDFQISNGLTIVIPKEEGASAVSWKKIVGESEKMTRRGGKENSKMREMMENGWPIGKGNRTEIRERE